MFIVYYDPGLDEIAQWYVPIGEAIDEVASTLGIIEMSTDEFPGIELSPDSPIPEQH